MILDLAGYDNSHGSRVRCASSFDSRPHGCYNGINSIQNDCDQEEYVAWRDPESRGQVEARCRRRSRMAL